MIQLSSIAAIIAHTGVMTSERPIFNPGDKRRYSASNVSKNNDESRRQGCAANRLTATLIAVENNVLTSIAGTNERLHRSVGIMTISTELIAISHQALARSRDLLNRRQPA
ncbi:hypothetical protein [Mesorhizobium sp. B2-4-9]|uniref:hypothetical protein n=1 Tax=Mesorhizobium sp. B2-4-9 TaxID=2589940 RepID=UPI001AED4DE4|nr:hypothetical protein [Mesorhizobium sp. B2-4-9]